MLWQPVFQILGLLRCLAENQAHSPHAPTQLPEVTMSKKSSASRSASRRAWQAPTIECREVRPEVTAYAGGGDPWLTR